MKNSKYCILLLSICVATTLYAAPAYAYIGPGMGIGAIAAVVTVIGSIFLALFAAIYYPIKRKIKSLKKKNQAVENEQSSKSQEELKQ